jgi:hypothetical protein
MGGTYTAYWEREKYRLRCMGAYEERDHLEDVDLDGIIRLNWIFKKYNGRPWAGFIWVWVRTSGMPL